MVVLCEKRPATIQDPEVVLATDNRRSAPVWGFVRQREQALEDGPTGREEPRSGHPELGGDIEVVTPALHPQLEHPALAAAE